LADVPAWSSSTSYYSGHRDGERDDAGHAGAARTNGAAYSAPASYPPDWTAPTHNGGGNGANGYGGNGYGGNGYDGANGYDGSNGANGYAADPRSIRGAPAATDAAAPTRSSRRAQAQAQMVHQRGLPGWGALLVLFAIAGVGGIIDTASGNNVRGGFNIALVIASLVAILIVRHRDMFPIVVAPPLVYIVASGVALYFRSGGLHNRHVVIDAAANWLVYGFPAIAGATAAVLIVAGVRLVIGK
jgi:hypothetical protein